MTIRARRRGGSGGGSSADWSTLVSKSLGADGDTFDSGTFTAMDELRFRIFLIATGGTFNGGFRFNSDSVANYVQRFSSNGAGGSGTDTNVFLEGGSVASGDVNMIYGDITNIAAFEKGGHMNTTKTIGTGIPDTFDSYFVWNNTVDRITQLSIHNLTGTGDMDADSYMIIEGRNR